MTTRRQEKDMIRASILLMQLKGAVQTFIRLVRFPIVETRSQGAIQPVPLTGNRHPRRLQALAVPRSSSQEGRTSHLDLLPHPAQREASRDRRGGGALPGIQGLPRL